MTTEDNTLPTAELLAHQLSRRQLLKFAALSSGSVVVATQITGCSGAGDSIAEGWRYFREADIILFTAITPAVLAGSAKIDNDQVLERVLRRIDESCALLTDAAQENVRDLLDLLHVRLLRWLSTGIWSGWASVEQQRADEFIQRWRHSRFDTLLAGHNLLVQLIASAYYRQAESRLVSGYPGPPSWAQKALA